MIPPRFPPLFTGQDAQGGDPFALAVAAADVGCDAGLVMYDLAADRLRAAIVFAPEVTLSDAAVILPICGVGLQNAIGALGAGDAKFAAAAAPFVALADLASLFYLFAGCLLSGYLIHRIVRASPLRRLVPDWESWESGRRFPMGLPLAATLILYLALPFLA